MGDQTDRVRDRSTKSLAPLEGEWGEGESIITTCTISLSGMQQAVHSQCLLVVFAK